MRNAGLEGVRDRVDLVTGDTRALPFADLSEARVPTASRPPAGRSTAVRSEHLALLAGVP